MGAVLIVVLVEVWLVRRAGIREAQLEGEIASRISEIERLQRQKPGPTEANLRAARQDLVENGRVLGTMLEVLNVTGPEDIAYFDGEPTTRTDAFFDIASFVDRMRAAAREPGIALNEDERFGFSQYTNEGPDPDLISPVYRQRRIAEYLLGKLFEARPRALISMHREDPATLVNLGRPDSAAPAARPPVGDGRTTASSDFFTIDPQVSARTPGYVDTMAFRIVFAGQTSALRGFLNALAAPDIPLVVRSVEVEPNVEEQKRETVRGRRPGGGGLFGRSSAQPSEEALSPNVPIVAENVSRFTVIVEMFVVKIRPPEFAEEGQVEP